MSESKQSLNLLRRTHCCGEPRAEQLGEEILVKGWVHFRRDHGGLIFIDLRDRSGLLQIVFDPSVLSAEAFQTAHDLRDEYVLAVKGQLRERPAGTVNSSMPTGEVELLIAEFAVLNRSEPTPFKLDEHHGNVSEELRLRYRYLDLRRPQVQKSMLTRAKLMRVTRAFLDGENFVEIDTPILTRSTPEGARDFLVPSRLGTNAFYALPQSPQLFKQSLMIAGYDRYYQIARCFRDEDFRANRQPEFTQIDIEMSFITPDDIIEIIERMMAAIYRGIKGVELELPLPRMGYDEALLRYGSDKPDLRFGLQIHEVTDLFRQGCEFRVFNDLLEKEGAIRAICVPGGAELFSNTQLKPDGELPKQAAIYGARGLAWFKVGAQGALESSIAKFFTPETQGALRDALGAKPGDLILLVGDRPAVAAAALGALRLKLGRQLNLIDDSAINFCWIMDFPLFDWNPNEKRWDPTHHPFTSPCEQDLPLLDSDPGKVKSWAYDLTLNGEEIGGGSIRIHNREIQEKVFEAIGIGEEEAKQKFGFLLDALTFGAPPHGGIAMGFDRILMLLLGETSIREVIPFPKTQSGACLMTDAPSRVDAAQLRELRIKIIEPKK